MSKIVDIADIYKLKKQAEEQGCTVGIYIDKGKSLGFSTDDLISFAKKGKTLDEILSSRKRQRRMLKSIGGILATGLVWLINYEVTMYNINHSLSQEFKERNAVVEKQKDQLKRYEVMLYETDSPEIKNTIRTEAQKIYNDLRWNYILRGYEDELVKYWVAKQKAINPLKHFSM